MSDVVRAHGLTRRAAMVRIGAGGLGVALAARGIKTLAAQEDEAAVSGEFVGVAMADGENHLDAIHVAVVAAPLTEGAASRRVRAYLCDGQKIAEWFVGEVDGNAVALDSEDGDARLEADLAEDGLRCSFVLPGGEHRDFEAARPTGWGGLY